MKGKTLRAENPQVQGTEAKRASREEGNGRSKSKTHKEKIKEKATVIWEKQVVMVANASSTLQGPWSVLGAVVTQSSTRLRVSKPMHFKYVLVCQVLKG